MRTLHGDLDNQMNTLKAKAGRLGDYSYATRQFPGGIELTLEGPNGAKTQVIYDPLKFGCTFETLDASMRAYLKNAHVRPYDAKPAQPRGHYEELVVAGTR